MTVHNQYELSEALRGGEKNIVLDGGKYRIPLNMTGIAYSGINDPIVDFSGKGEIFLDDYGISVAGCIFDDNAKNRMIDNVPDNIAIEEQEQLKRIEREKMPPKTSEQEYEEDIRLSYSLAEKCLEKNDIEGHYYYLADLCYKAKSRNDFRTEYEAACKMKTPKESLREEKKLFKAEALCYMGRAREGIKLFEQVIGGKTYAEEAVISLSRFYRKRCNIVKAEYWHLYGINRFGIEGHWDYYKDYDDQIGTAFEDDDDEEDD